MRGFNIFILLSIFTICHFFLPAASVAKPQGQPSAFFSYENLCLGDSTAFTDESTVIGGNLTLIHWDFGDGYDTYAAPGETVYHRYKEVGDYIISITAISDSDDSDSYQETISIIAVPEISFTYTGDSILSRGESTVIGTSESYAQYQWSTNATGSEITIDHAGRYWLQVTTTEGCTAIDSTIQFIMQGETINIESNILTPNGDGINDYLRIKDFEDFAFPCQIHIYNAWNVEVYSSSDYQNNWQGEQNNGSLVNAGTYFYIIQSADKPKSIGSINVIH